MGGCFWGCLAGWSNNGETNPDRRFSLARIYGLGPLHALYLLGGGQVWVVGGGGEGGGHT